MNEDKPSVMPPVPPFVRFVASAVPMVFDDSLSYYEALCALWKYVSDMTDVINNNATLEEEYIEKFNELKSFVDNYFENLDVQEEINNKLDEMAEDGTLTEIISEVLHLGYNYDTFTTFAADTDNHHVGVIAKTLGHTTVGDEGGATYIITDSEPSGDYETLPNSLYAKIIMNNGIRREDTPEKNYYEVQGTRMYGVNKSSQHTINQSSDHDSTISVLYNECTLERLSLDNPDAYANKTAIKVNTPSQRLHADNIFIHDNYEVGLSIPTAFYSYFNDMFIKGETGVAIGKSNDQGAWIGVLDFNSCHINGCDLAVREYSKDTNTICFDKCSFENNIKYVENDGTLYFRNSYFGDNKEDSGEIIDIYTGNAGSNASFTDSTIGLIATDHTNSGERESVFKLKSSGGVGSKVFVKGGIIHISNDGIKNSSSSIYNSDSNLNEIYLDYVKFIPSSNRNHSQYPYYLYEGYSPLRSLEPIQNYVLNGTMKDPLANSFVGVEASHSSMDANLTNPFGGKVATFTRSGTSGGGYSNFYYKIPKSLVGKPMVLEIYGLSNINAFDVNAPSLGLNYTVTYLKDTHTTDGNRVRLYRATVTPSAESGLIQTLLHWSDATDGASYKLSGVILKEAQYGDYLSCYKDLDMRMSKVIPTDTANAVKGDIVYASPDSTAGVDGWIFNGTTWQAMNTYS